MSDVQRYSLEDDLEAAAEDAARELPEQIARVRSRVKEALARLSANDDDAGYSDQSPS